MFYVFWLILNLALFASAVIVAFKLIRLIREKAGIVTAVIAAFLLLAFMSRGDESGGGTNNTPKWTFNSTDSIAKNSSGSKTLALDKNPLSKNMLILHYGKDRQRNTVLPLYAFSVSNGLTGGTKWVPVSVMATASSANTINYVVEGAVEWNLLWVTVYREEKVYRGRVEVE